MRSRSMTSSKKHIERTYLDTLRLPEVGPQRMVRWWGSQFFSQTTSQPGGISWDPKCIIHGIWWRWGLFSLFFFPFANPPIIRGIYWEYVCRLFLYHFLHIYYNIICIRIILLYNILFISYIYIYIVSYYYIYVLVLLLLSLQLLFRLQ